MRIRIIFYVTRQTIRYKKVKIKPFLSENDAEIIF